MPLFTVQADNGDILPIDSLAQEFAYNGDFLETITINYGGKTYIQTFTNNGTNITSISKWEVQP